MKLHRSVLCCFSFMLLATQAAAQTVLYREDFESGLSAWTSTSLWHLANDTDACLAPVLPLPSGSACVWFGKDAGCNFQNVSPGTLQLIQPITLPAFSGYTYLHFRQFVATESCSFSMPGKNWDISVPEISTNGGQSWLTLPHQCAAAYQWYSYRASINVASGASVLLRFKFDSVDHVFDESLGWLVDDIEIRLEPGVPYCDVEGLIPGFCPCPSSSGEHQNFPSQVGGCKHSGGQFGELAAAGGASIASDDVVLSANDLLPFTTVVFLQGSVLSPGVVFGDGFRCVGGSLIRLAIKSAVDGVVSFPDANEPTLSAAGSLPANGGTFGYQVYYRDAANFCTPAGFNASNAYRIIWSP